MNSLGTHVPNTGSITGLHETALKSESNEIRILMVHGMGWTNETNDFGNDFARGILDHYGIEGDPEYVTSVCPKSDPGEPEKTVRGNTIDDVGGIPIEISSQTNLFSDLAVPNALRPANPGCMDVMRITTPSGPTYTLYRVFWDDAFWNAYQFPHVGFDDRGQHHDGIVYYPDAANGPQPTRTLVPEDRAPLNAELKDQIVTHGLSDATLYLSPAGIALRETITSAICLAYDDEIAIERLDRIDSTMCDAEIVEDPEFAIAFVSESLGSRIIFDVLANRFEENDVISAIRAQEPELYMLANQVALIGIGQMQTTPATVAPDNSLPRIIAISEVNDPLTFEITPYIEFLALRSGVFQDRQELNRPENRALLQERLGYDVTDVRVRFADPVFGPVGRAIGLYNPLQAHTGHAEQDLLMQLMLCGNQDSNALLPNECS